MASISVTGAVHQPRANRQSSVSSFVDRLNAAQNSDAKSKSEFMKSRGWVAPMEGFEKSSRFGVGARLLLAFLGISSFAAIVGATGVFAFLEIGTVIDRITKERVPSALAAQDVSRQAGRVVSSAPVLLTVGDDQQLTVRSREVDAEVERLEELIQILGKTDFSPAELRLIWDINRQLRLNLVALNTQIRGRLKQAADKKDALEKAQFNHDQIRQLLEPWALVTDARITKWRDAVERRDEAVEDRAAVDDDLKESLSWLRALNDLELLLVSVSESLQRLATSEDPEKLRLSGFRLTLLMRKAGELVKKLDPKLQSQLSELLEQYEGFVVGDQNILNMRRSELLATEEAEKTLEQNAALSNQLTDAVSELVERAQNDITAANEEADIVQGVSLTVTIAVVFLSLLCSVLIVWLYVGRNLVARLTALSNSMLEIAGGNLKAPLPVPRSGDEISRMAEALTVFRDTAVEVEENNLREIEETRRRLVDAIENTSEGFAFYDDQDRLVICNTRYRDLLYSGTKVTVEPGMKFEEIIRRAAEKGYIIDAEGRVEDWVQARLKIHLNPGEPHLQQRADGRWILVSERKTGDGGIVAVYSDITELKRREQKLAEQSEALEEKTRVLEQLSNQLAKYLSPQVYDSIFSGRQEVKVASSRKKLTVFFSDIAGFTETADRLESEELTQLLNHYLTEMSRIAMEYGATIDKYVGDAILIFFGDPETRGVKDDAVACVEMAIAMRKRMIELKDFWRESGIERPLQVRTGIHTGFCTVGNFGSEDRMDYTIIGGAVNTASRLESIATPGEIFISYETFALVRDRVACEEKGQIEVKGIAYPVAAYQVLDTHENLGRDRRHFHELHPNVSVDLDIAAMTGDDRSQAISILRRALSLLSAESEPSRKEPATLNGSDPDRENLQQKNREVEKTS